MRESIVTEFLSLDGVMENPIQRHNNSMDAVQENSFKTALHTAAGRHRSLTMR